MGREPLGETALNDVSEVGQGTRVSAVCHVEQRRVLPSFLVLNTDFHYSVAFLDEVEENCRTVFRSDIIRNVEDSHDRHHVQVVIRKEKQLRKFLRWMDAFLTCTGVVVVFYILKEIYDLPVETRKPSMK